MALKNILSRLNSSRKNGSVYEDITKERIQNDLPNLQKLIAYWRWYPDKFVDYMCSLNPDNTFRFFFYQRV